MRMYVLLSVVACLCCLVLFSGCASIMCGSEKTINVASYPPETKFTIKNPRGGVIVQDTTPTNVTLKRGRGWFQAGDYTVTFEKPGYKTTTVPIPQGLEVGWYLGGNFLIGGLIGWVIVDPLTGAMWNIEDVNVSLEPEKSAMHSIQTSTSWVLAIQEAHSGLRPQWVTEH